MADNHGLSDEALDRPAVSAPTVFTVLTKAPESADSDLSDEALDRPLGGGASASSGCGLACDLIPPWSMSVDRLGDAVKST